jgi:hypothetical protein
MVLNTDSIRNSLRYLFLFSYTPLIIAIQHMLEYDNNNHISDTKVSY